MRYSKEQVRAMGGLPPRRTDDRLTRRELREVRIAAKCAIDGELGLKRMFRESGIPGTLEAWARAQVHGLWQDIGEPVFTPKTLGFLPYGRYENMPEVGAEGGWYLPHGGFWPYLGREYLDISHVVVGKRIINLDEIYCFLRDVLGEVIKENKKGNKQ